MNLLRILDNISIFYYDAQLGVNVIKLELPTWKEYHDIMPYFRFQTKNKSSV